MVRRIISLFCVVVILFSCCLSVYADLADVGEYYVTNFWDALQGKGIDVGFKFWKNITGYFVGQECPSSPDKYHHGPKPAFGSGTGGSDENGRFSWVTCDHCGKQFKVYSSFVGGSGGGFGKSDLQQSYEAQVEELPATGYQSDGSLLIIVPISSHSCFVGWHDGGASYTLSCSNHTVSSSSQPGSNCPLVSFLCDSNVIKGVTSSGTSYSYFYGVSISSDSFSAPYDGYYQLLAGSGISLRYTLPADNDLEEKSSGVRWSGGSSIYYEAGASIPSFFLPLRLRFNTGIFSFYAQCYSPVLKFTPVPSMDINFDATYNINSRPTSITGDYGIIGDNGQIIKVECDKIVNETNNNYYNPATGETHTMSDWSYNYEDRSYTVTTESGDTVTITYGDENVTIVEGDTTYNVYYLVNGSGSEDPGPDVPDVCDHTWTETGRTEPTCTTAGKVTSICSKCGQTKTEPIPATGHTWVVDRTVQTEYDEEGNLLQQGYTIYSCSVCGEQYKDMEGTGPPGPEEEKSIWEKIGDFFGTIGGGFIDIIGAIVGKLLDALIALAEMLMGKLKTVVETVLSIFDELPALFGGFLDFLGAIFPFLPPEITTILTFGVVAVVFIGILKAVRR